MTTLDIAISTYKPEGIKRVEKMLRPLSPQEGVKYIVSWQEHENVLVPDSLRMRDDVEIYRFELRGLSNNRNNAIEHCSGEIVLIADDDLEYYPDFAEKIRKSFETDESLDLTIFKVNFKNKKPYPLKDCKLTVPFPKKYFCSSVEIAFRRDKIGDLQFWEGMGLGNKILQSGEDELFLFSAVKRGLNCRFVNKFIANHPEESTGDKISDGILRSQGFIIYKTYPFSSILRIPLKAYRVYRSHKASFFKSLRFLTEGVWMAVKRFRTIPKSNRW